MRGGNRTRSDGGVGGMEMREGKGVDYIGARIQGGRVGGRLGVSKKKRDKKKREKRGSAIESMREEDEE